MGSKKNRTLLQVEVDEQLIKGKIVLRGLFIPEKIGTYYIIPQRILGFEVTPTHIYACQLSTTGQKIIIDSCFTEPIKRQGNRKENVEKAINTILLNAKSTSIIHSCIPSSQAIFKTLHFPFTSREKIAKVVDYEVEPALPFSLKNAVIDFIITKTNVEQEVAEVLVVAVQRKYIEQNLALFQSLNQEPSLFTIDMIALYQLYKKIPDYAELPGVTILIDAGSYETRLVYILEGQLKLIRTLTKGLPDYLDRAAKQLKLSEPQVISELIHPTKKEQQATLESILAPYWKDISFTISSFRSQLGTSQDSRILLLGAGAELKDSAKLFQKKLLMTCDYFQLNKLLYNKEIVSKIKGPIPPRNSISLAVALPTFEDDEFNLYKYVSSKKEVKLVYKQLITAGALALGIIFSLLAFSIFQSRKFKKELTSSVQETVDTLVKTFGTKIQPKIGTLPMKALQRVVDDAEREVIAKEKMWFAFSAPAQVTYLRYLYELFTGLDQEALGLEIKKLDLREGTITIDGKVKDYDALEQFDRFIQSSPLFGRIVRGSLQEPTFNIDIELNKNGEEE